MSERPLSIVRIAGVPEPFNLPWMLGLERRAFVRAGLEVKWRTVPQGTGAMCTLLQQEEVDMAVLVTEGAVRGIAEGGSFRIVGSLVDTPLTWGVHVPAGSLPGGTEQFSTMPYAISRIGSGSHVMALVHAHRLGRTLTEKDLVLVNDLKGAVDVFKSGRKVTFLWEKAITSPLVRSGAWQRVEDLSSPWPGFVIVARNEYLREHDTQVVRMLRVFRDQAKGFMEKKAGPEMVAQRYGLELSEAQEWYRSTRWSVQDDGLIPGLATIIGELHSAGILERDLAVEDLVDRAFVHPSRGR